MQTNTSSTIGGAGGILIGYGLSAVQTSMVTIQNFTFNPQVVTIKQGDTVTWINKDTVTHRIKSDTFNSIDLNQGDKFQFTFKTKGTYDYICSIHPTEVTASNSLSLNAFGISL